MAWLLTGFWEKIHGCLDGLRHTFAAHVLENGMDIKTLSALADYVSSATPLNVYVTDEMRYKAID